MPDIVNYQQPDLKKIVGPQQRKLLRVISQEASRMGLPLYVVGGFVRDLLLGQPGLDFDLVAEGDAVGLAHAVAGRHGGSVTVHPRFKTAQWFPPTGAGFPVFVDFTSARSETYKQPAALPTVKPGSLTDDLRRRDFTINTLALRLDGSHFGELHAELGGLEDLRAGLLQVLHSGSFRDDPTRLFRLVRYEQRYGFEIAPPTLALIKPALVWVDHLSSERVRHELELILEEPSSASILKRLAELAILAAVHPALGCDPAAQARLVRGLAAATNMDRPPNRRTLAWCLWLMAVPRPTLVGIEKRLHFDARLWKTLRSAASLYAEVDALAGKKPSRVASALDKLPLKAVQAVSVALPDGPERRQLSCYLETWRHIKPKTDGHTLEKRGLIPGPQYKVILRRLRDAWLDGEVKSLEEEKSLLDGLIGKYI